MSRRHRPTDVVFVRWRFKYNNNDILLYYCVPFTSRVVMGSKHTHGQKYCKRHLLYDTVNTL